MLEKFINDWLPRTKEWQNIAKFIMNSGVQILETPNLKWLPGYTNISVCSKPHHLDPKHRFMEEMMFVLHDICHQIFTMENNCNQDEYVRRQMYGEFFTFYLTEYTIPQTWDKSYKDYIDKRQLNNLVYLLDCNKRGKNIIDFMWDVFIDSNYTIQFAEKIREEDLGDVFIKTSRMFREDLEASKKNYSLLPSFKSYCIVGSSSQNHIDFFEAVKSGAIKNIKRDFNLKLPKKWN